MNVCVYVCARDLVGVTLSSMRSFFSSLSVAKYAQDQFLVQISNWSRNLQLTARTFMAVTQRVIDGELI